MFADIDRKTFGEAALKTYNDWDGIQQVTALPEHAPHRNVDKIVIDVSGSRVKTAIVVHLRSMVLASDQGTSEVTRYQRWQDAVWKESRPFKLTSVEISDRMVVFMIWATFTSSW